MDAPNLRERYLPYEVPLQLAGTLRRWARTGHARQPYHPVPGCVLLIRPARSRARSAVRRAPGALAWRVAASPMAGRPVTPGAASASVRPPARHEQTVARAATRPERSPGLNGGLAPRTRVGAAPLARPPVGAAPDWTRLKRSRRGTSRATPQPAALVSSLVALRWSAPAIGVRGGGASLNALARMSSAAVTPPAGGAPGDRAGRATSDSGQATGATPGRKSEVPEARWDLVFASGPEAGAEPAPRSAANPSAPPTEPPAWSRPSLAGASPSAFTWRAPVSAAAWLRSTSQLERTVDRMVERTVERMVEREVAERRGPMSPATARASRGAGGREAVTPAVTEQLVSRVVSRLRALGREERFRTGRLR